MRRGEITRGPCEVCGSSKTHGHHEDYSRPLDVVWLCGLHHRELHRLERKYGKGQTLFGFIHEKEEEL